MQAIIVVMATMGITLLLFVGGVAAAGLFALSIFRLTTKTVRLDEPPMLMLREAVGKDLRGVGRELIRNTSVGWQAPAAHEVRRIAA